MYHCVALLDALKRSDNKNHKKEKSLHDIHFLFCQGKEGRKKRIPLRQWKILSFLFFVLVKKNFFFTFFLVPEEYEDQTTRSEEKLTQVPKFLIRIKLYRNKKVKTKITNAYPLNLFHFQSLRHIPNQSLWLKQKKKIFKTLPLIECHDGVSNRVV